MITLILALSLTVPVEAPGEKELSEAAKKELRKLEGKWRAVKMVFNGEEQPGTDGVDAIFEFKGQTVTYIGKEFVQVVGLDPGAEPKSINFKGLISMAEVAKGKSYEAIYKLDDETLMVATHIGKESKRPRQFESAKDSDVVVLTLKRAK